MKLTAKQQTAKKTKEETQFSSTNQPENGSQHLKFETERELQDKISEYFESCNTRVIKVYDKKKQEVVEIVSQIPYTVEGLCDTLDIDRRTLLNYSLIDRYFHTIRKAKIKIHRNKMERGLEGLSNPSVTMFDVKNNHDYKDKTEVESTGKDGGPIQYSDMTTEEIDQRLKELRDKEDEDV